MKLKEIKKNMIIHCKTEDEANQLLRELTKLGYSWLNGNELTLYNEYEQFKEKTCYKIHADKTVSLNGFEYFFRYGNYVTEFSDLIIPEEMSAVEVLKIFTEICSDYGCGEDCQFNYIKEKSETVSCPEFVGEFPEEVIEICQQWKADHEKKEPEVEWVWQTIDGNSLMKDKAFISEDEAIKYCEEKIKERGIGNEYSYRKICREKE